MNAMISPVNPVNPADLADRVVAAIKALAGTHEVYEEPDCDQRVAAYWWGRPDDSVAWWLSICGRIADDPVAQSLYLARVAEDMSQRRVIKDWAYRAAAKFAGAKGSGQRRRSMVESYRLDWGHQAARDGVFMALWGDLEDVPGIVSRCERFGCGKQAYQRVRDEVCSQAKDLIASFRGDMEQCRTGQYNRHFRARWEDATDADFDAGLSGIGKNKKAHSERGKVIYAKPQPTTSDSIFTKDSMARQANDAWSDPQTLYPTFGPDSLWHPDR